MGRYGIAFQKGGNFLFGHRANLGYQKRDAKYLEQTPDADVF